MKLNLFCGTSTKYMSLPKVFRDLSRLEYLEGMLLAGTYIYESARNLDTSPRNVKKDKTKAVGNS